MPNPMENAFKSGNNKLAVIFGREAEERIYGGKSAREFILGKNVFPSSRANSSSAARDRLTSPFAD